MTVIYIYGISKIEFILLSVSLEIKYWRKKVKKTEILTLVIIVLAAVLFVFGAWQRDKPVPQFSFILNGQPVDSVEELLSLPGAHVSADGRVIFNGVVTDVGANKLIIDVGGNTLSITGDALSLGGPVGVVTLANGKEGPLLGNIPISSALVKEPLTIWVGTDMVHNFIRVN